MKKFTAICLLLTFLLAATELNQLLKLPIMLEHFAEHKNLNNTISFLDFLYMHYTGHDINDNDEDKDMQLPFKSHDCNSVQVQSLPTQSEFSDLNRIPVSEKNLPVYKTRNFNSSYPSSIWQPPKAC